MDRGFGSYPSMGYGTAGAETLTSISTLLVVVLEPVTRCAFTSSPCLDMPAWEIVPIKAEHK